MHEMMDSCNGSSKTNAAQLIACSATIFLVAFRIRDKRAGGTTGVRTWWRGAALTGRGGLGAAAAGLLLTAGRRGREWRRRLIGSLGRLEKGRGRPSARVAWA